MVYVGKKGDGMPPEDEVRIPQRYSGNAFGADGVRRSFDPDGEALRHAEELFRRGYVFEDDGAPRGAEDSGGHDVGEGTVTANNVRPGEAVADTARPVAPPDAVPTGAAVKKDIEKDRGRAAPARPQGGLLGGIFDRISTEEILLGAIILILFLNGTDDELLIMLVILLFC